MLLDLDFRKEISAIYYILHNTSLKSRAAPQNQTHYYFCNEMYAFHTK